MLLVQRVNIIYHSIPPPSRFLRQVADEADEQRFGNFHKFPDLGLANAPLEASSSHWHPPFANHKRSRQKPAVAAAAGPHLPPWLSKGRVADHMLEVLL